MTLLNNIKEGKCSVDELEELLDERNPMILYHVMTAIGKREIYNERILKKLYELSYKRDMKDKLLGYYKVGDLAIVTLQRIGENIDELPPFQGLNDFDKKMLVQLAKEIDW